jgi:hypothetical protein
MVNPRLTGKSISIRNSQVKFINNDKELNIVRCATYSPGYLNR